MLPNGYGDDMRGIPLARKLQSLKARQWLEISNAISVLCGFVGAILLALSVGSPPVQAGYFFYGNRKYDIAFIISHSYWSWGIALLISSFVLQMPDMLRRLLQSRDS